ncbi:MAG: DNA topoisomerase 3 [Clostridia bacterium]|nr:DNA topoisomerase 3 [Clostridia bacterium]
MAELVITEKPSVARSIANVLGAREKYEGYISGNGYVVSWCIGHLVGSAEPEVYDEKYKTWRYEDLPIVPEVWKYAVLSKTVKQFSTLKKLMNDHRITAVICATDAGREGELIFRLVYQETGCKLPIKRLWISSMEKESILNGFRSLKDGAEYDNLYKAALCRDHADWLVGINATRLYTLLYGRTLKVGRVMSPTLAMIVNREESIQSFVPEKFYTVCLTNALMAKSERLQSRMQADTLARMCEGMDAVITNIENKRKTETPPRLYDLTTLQRDANRYFGYTAQQTLDFTQSLYEKQLVTYPRTDSQYISHDMEDRIPMLVKTLGILLPCTNGLNLSINPAQIVNDKKVSDHHAIIPTRNAATPTVKLSDGERTILSLIMIRLICAVGDPCIYDDLTVTVKCSDHPFKAKAQNIVQMGWKIPWLTFRGSYDTSAHPDEEKVLPLPEDMKVGSIIHKVVPSVQEGTTTPPRRYTEDSILAAMESAGNAEMPDDAERKGIGTPATRAGILEKLVTDGLVERKGNGKTKHLVPTEKGTSLIAVLPEQLQSPLLTAEWEQKLKQIENGEADPDAFIHEISRMINDLVRTAQRVPNAADLFPVNESTVGKCPNCGAAVIEKQKGFFCENRICNFALWKNNRKLMPVGKPPTKEMIRTLLSDGQVEAKGLISQNGKPYNALLIMDCSDDGNARIRPVFAK